MSLSLPTKQYLTIIKSIKIIAFSKWAIDFLW